MKKLQIAESLTDLIKFLENTKNGAEFSLEKIKLSSQREWKIRDGALSHQSNGFFHVIGAEHNATGEQHLLLFQPQSARTGLALFKDKEKIYVLLQARVEPGNSNIVQYGPTIQSTPANYLQLHGGKKNEYIDLFLSFHPESIPLGNTTQFDLGKRYFHKNKSHEYVLLTNIKHTKETMIWASLEAISQALTMNNFLNADLRSLISVFDWDLFLGKLNKSSQQSTRLYIGDSNLGQNQWKTIPLHQLTNWKIQEEGIEDISNAGIWISMHRIKSQKRETKQWDQPLLHASTRGLTILMTRMVKGQYEFLLSFGSEFGISGQTAVFPSHVTYPGETLKSNHNIPTNQGTLVAEIVQSEEGGRFYKNENVYQIILADKKISPAPHQKWVTAQELKSILKSSCMASFQLRCAASLVMGTLNPHTYTFGKA